MYMYINKAFKINPFTYKLKPFFQTMNQFGQLPAKVVKPISFSYSKPKKNKI